MKRYRYTGKERDDENALVYHGVRYYAPWLARWTGCEPKLDQAIGSTVSCLYAYVLLNPMCRIDDKGDEPTRPSLWEKLRESRIVKVILLAVGMSAKDPLNPSKAKPIDPFSENQPAIKGKKDAEKMLIEENRPRIVPSPPDPKEDIRGDIVRNQQGEIEGIRIRGPEDAPGVKITFEGNSAQTTGGSSGGKTGGSGGKARVVGMAFTGITLVSILGSEAPATEKAKALAGSYVFGKVVNFAATSIAGAELAEILDLPLALVFNLCDNCEQQKRIERDEAQQAFLEKINGRAMAIFYNELTKGDRPEWQFAYEKAVQEKYVELGLDKIGAAQQKARIEMFGDPNPNVCSKYTPHPVLDLSPPAPVYNGPRMSAY